jgi:general secretion pathway protein D
MNSTNAPDAGAPAQDAAVPDQTGAINADSTAPAESQPVETTAILPKSGTPEVIPSAFTPPAQVTGTNQNDLNLNFVNAPLDMVLNYLSDAAGFIIVQTTRVSGTVTVVGKHLTQQEAVDLLNSELNRNNYAAIRNGRTLTIMGKNEARTQNIPVKTGNVFTNIPNNDEIATWIIPIRFVDAAQLVSDLELFVSPQATIVANAAGNSIIITDTQSNIRHLAEIIRSVDDSAEAETEIRVFPLKFASPADVANELSSIFPSSTGAQSPFLFAGGRRGGGGNAGDSSQQRIQKAQQVNAVPDSRIQAVVVTAPKDLMDEIASMMTELDVPSTRDQNVYVFQTKNGDPQAMVTVLQSMFGGGNSSTSRGGTSSTTTSPLTTRANANTMSSTTTTSGSTGIGGTGGSSGRSF